MDWRDIEAELKALGVSLGEFYDRAGIARSTWQRFRAGKFELRADTARRVDAAMRVLRAERFGHSGGGDDEGGGGGKLALAVEP